MKVKLDSVDVSAYADVFSSLQGESDLSATMQVVDIRLVDEDLTIAKRPRRGHKLEVFDDYGVLQLFGGRVSELELLADHPTGLAWLVHGQSHEARLFETTTGSLNKAGIVDTDRNFVIAILRDALKQQTFGASAAVTDDPIATANEPDWPGVKATARLVGQDWSYKPARDALESLRTLIPDVYLRIRPDARVEWFRPRDVAPFVFSSSPDEPKRLSYREEVLADNPVAYWRLGEGCNDANAIDASGNGRHATYSGDPIRGVAGFADDSNGAVLFDGVDDAAQVVGFPITAAFTLEVIARFRGATFNDRGLLSSRSNNGFILFLPVGTTRLDFYIASSAGVQTATASWDFGTLAPLHHLAFTYEGANAKIYVDGILKATAPAVIVRTATNITLDIGQDIARYFEGSGAEVAVYGSALGPARILAHAQARFRRRIAFANYRETEISGGHRNKMRRGGTGAAEETAFDEVSYALYRRILDDPYVNDETIPAGVLRQMTYAELRAHRVRRVANATTNTPGLRAGMVVELANARLGAVGMVDPLKPQGWYPDTFLAVPLRSPDGLAKNHRGRRVIQKVSPATLEDGTIEYALQLGDAMPDLPTALTIIATEAGL
jgi:hypothetical protein